MEIQCGWKFQGAQQEGWAWLQISETNSINTNALLFFGDAHRFSPGKKVSKFSLAQKMQNHESTNAIRKIALMPDCNPVYWGDHY